MPGLEPRIMQKATQTPKASFLCHANAQPYVAHSSEINGSAGWAAERQAGSLLRR